MIRVTIFAKGLELLRSIDALGDNEVGHFAPRAFRVNGDCFVLAVLVFFKYGRNHLGV